MLTNGGWKLMKDKLPKRIGMVVEGTYPYVSGGVASWIHQLITEFQEFEFYLIAIMAKKKDIENMKYKLPKNVKGIYHIFLQEYPKKPFFYPEKIIGKEKIENFLKTYSYSAFVEMVKFIWFQKHRAFYRLFDNYLV